MRLLQRIPQPSFHIFFQLKFRIHILRNHIYKGGWVKARSTKHSRKLILQKSCKNLHISPIWHNIRILLYDLRGWSGVISLHDIQSNHIMDLQNPKLGLVESLLGGIIAFIGTPQFAHASSSSSSSKASWVNLVSWCKAFQGIKFLPQT